MSVRFLRRELRAWAGISDTQLGLHLERLVRMEYLVTHAGRRGQSYVYELVFDGDVAATTPQLPGLTDLVARVDDGTTAKVAGGRAKFTGSSRPQTGAIPGSLREIETARSASPDAVLSSLVAAVDDTAVPRRRVNGASHRSVTATEA